MHEWPLRRRWPNGVSSRLAAIRHHRFDWRDKPILAFDDDGARSIADAHDDPAIGELLHAGANLQSIFAAAGMIDNNGWSMSRQCLNAINPWRTYHA